MTIKCTNNVRLSVILNVILQLGQVRSGDFSDTAKLLEHEPSLQGTQSSVQSPFFFLCNAPQQGEPTTRLFPKVSIGLTIGGNKTIDDGYEPLQMYELLVDLTEHIDGFILTGAHFVTKEFTDMNHITLPPSTKNVNSAGLICTILHQHISRKPQLSFSFVWQAPQTGTGCVRFLATGSMQDDILFKDLMIKEVCQNKDTETQKTGDITQSLAFSMGRDPNAFVLYENFDAPTLDKSVWSNPGEVILKNTDSTTGSGYFYGPPNKTTVLHTFALDFSKAQHLYYTIGKGGCNGSRSIKVYLGSILYDDIGTESLNSHQTGNDSLLNEAVHSPIREDIPDYLLVTDEPDYCNYWEQIDYQRTEANNKVHIIGIPTRFIRSQICLKFVPNNSSDDSNDDCWTLDDVAVVTTESHQGNLWEDFDNIYPSNWLFFPGGKIKESCNSQGNAMQFEGSGLNMLKSRQLDFSHNFANNSDLIFYQDFSEIQLNSWSITGNQSCSIATANGLRFAAPGIRKICSSKIDTSIADIVILRGGGGEDCLVTEAVMVNFTLLDSANNLIYSINITLNSVMADTVIIIPVDQRNRSISVCIQQDGEFLTDDKSWSIKELALLPWLPSSPTHYFQMFANLQCSSDPAEVSIDASLDGGKSWTPVVSKCTHAGCSTYPKTLSGMHAVGLDTGWGLVTLPLPYSALGSHTIMRIAEIRNDEGIRSSWVVDNIFIGRCNEGCNGHGLCQIDGTCKCEYGFSGNSCNIVHLQQPIYMFEPFVEDSENSANILTISGGKSSFRCGIIGTGTAAVFNGEKERALTTVDLDTTDAHVIQFYFQSGTYSQVGKCPGPDRDEESISLHYSCSGGTVWKLLHTLHANSHKTPSLISLSLPAEARNKACRFQIWQPNHSGYEKDLWAIDDLTITSKQTDSIEISFDDYREANDSLRFLLGKIDNFCGREDSLVFIDHNDNGLTRFMETKSITIGPSFIIQFDLVIGCASDASAEKLESTISLEYSLTHGLTWQLVQRPCTPSTPSCEAHFSTGTIYHSSEFNSWKRVTLLIPQHVWSQAVRFRLRQYETSEFGIPWAVDNVYIGKLCNGCSGHGYCTVEGCRCDDGYHGYKCFPRHKLNNKLSYTFEDAASNTVAQYWIIGGELANGLEGCGTVVSGNNLYFGKTGIREFQTDDIMFEEPISVMLTLVIGAEHVTSKNCIPSHTISEFTELHEGSVVLEFSTNAGICWNLLKEFVADSYRQPRQVHVKIDEEITEGIIKPGDVVRFRLWQPKHSIGDQWAVDDVIIFPYEEKNTFMADFKEGALLNFPWLSSSAYTYKTYCGSGDISKVFESREPVRIVVTETLKLNEDDVIMFEISVGCKSEWSTGQPVVLEYSRDGGENWFIVQEKCLPSSPDCPHPRESSTYWPGHHGPWTKILIKVDHKIAERDITLRWKQLNPSQTPTNEFGLRKIYIGSPCNSNCNGHGICTAEHICKCDDGFSGSACEERASNSLWMKDTFEKLDLTKSLWTQLEGASLSLGCGQQRDGHVLMLSGDGPRLVETNELDTYDIGYIVFELGIGAKDAESHCDVGVSPRDNVLFEYSTNNGLEWQLIREFEPAETILRKTPYIIHLPYGARSLQTKFRWSQTAPFLLDLPERQAEWEIDNVMIMANESYPLNLDTSVDPNEMWFLVSGANKYLATHNLHFSDSNIEKYAETWDILGQEESFVQFDLLIRNENKNRHSFIRLEYSKDHGTTWNLFNGDDTSGNANMLHVNLPSVYSSDKYRNRSREIIPLPTNSIGYPIRLRFYQQESDKFAPGGNFEWEVENLFIGNSCPWMCSGHGYCLSAECRCDDGYFGEFCVPASILPCELADNFDAGGNDLWTDIQGAEITEHHGILVQKSALVFIKEGLRYATTIDLDMTGGKFLQFTIYHTNSRSSTHYHSSMTHSDYPEQDKYTMLQSIFRRQEEEILNEVKNPDKIAVLVQFSINGGVIWKTMENILVEDSEEAQFYSISFDDFPNARTNATRFRLWQRGIHVTSKSSWAVDSVYIGGMKEYPNVLYDDFESGIPNKDAWIEWPAGSVGPMCQSDGKKNALTFTRSEGQHALYTKDLYINPYSVIQFDIRVGCENVSIARDKVSLQYSIDHGVTWYLLREPCVLDQSTPHCLTDLQTPSVYFPNSVPGWKTVTIPLNIMRTCGDARFRWWQDNYHAGKIATDWAIDNVYIGPSCRDHCRGHGYCINGDRCNCDLDYAGEETCYSVKHNPKEILLKFENHADTNLLTSWSGGEISSQCEVIDEFGLFFWMEGERIIVTKDLDLEQGGSIEFYLRFGCTQLWESSTDSSSVNILLMFSIDGGIHWINIRTIYVTDTEIRPQTNFFSIDIPMEAKTNSTKLRWWQPSINGTFANKWAIDHIYVSSSDLAQTYFYDDGKGENWLIKPASIQGISCNLKGLHVMGIENRFVESREVLMERNSFLQVEVVLGCETTHCYEIRIEYTTNHGKSWHLLENDCHPMKNCAHLPSILKSDVYTMPDILTIFLPDTLTSWQKTARFRLVQNAPYKQEHSWIVSRTYIGDQCPTACLGRGFCDCGICICNEGWSGKNCEICNGLLPDYVADDFENQNTTSANWNKIIGGKITDACGPVASKSALHFYGGCTRLLESRDMDLRTALFVQFNIITDCLEIEQHDWSNYQLRSENSVPQHPLIVQMSCDSGISWKTLKELKLVYKNPKYIWLKIPLYYRCLGGRIRWIQESSGANMNDWAIDGVFIGGKVTPSDELAATSPADLKFPAWHKAFNWVTGKYCNKNEDVAMLESTPSEVAVLQTGDIYVGKNHSIHFNISLGCSALWNNNIEPVRLEYSIDFGRSWKLVRDICLPYNSSSCSQINDESIFYAPQEWQYYVFPLNSIGPSKYTRFRWIQASSAEVAGSHIWAVVDIYIGTSCLHHCLGRGKCISKRCYCQSKYIGDYCQTSIADNLLYIKDEFKVGFFKPHWTHVQGGMLSDGCGNELEEPPAAIFQGSNGRVIFSVPLDTRSGRFVTFTAHIGSGHGNGLCRLPTSRDHNVFLQYSNNGGIHWHLLRELDYNLYTSPREDYIILPRKAMTAATSFRFWQPRLDTNAPAWSLDNVFIGGSEIGTAQFIDSFNGEPTVAEWLFAPHSHMEENYCERGDNGSLVWKANHPGHRSITTQELIIYDRHILQFKILVGCQQYSSECYTGPIVNLEFNKDGGANQWQPLKDICYPETSHDPNCVPYVFHSLSTYGPDMYSTWTRITIPLPEKTWSRSAQLRWIQDAGRDHGLTERILPWALDDVYVGIACKLHCRGHGDCIEGKCKCDVGYEGSSCEPSLSLRSSFPNSLVDGFEGGVRASWSTVTGGSVGLGCNSLAPHGNGKHLYFNGCGKRQAVTVDLDATRATKISFVLRIGSHDHTPSCMVDVSNPKEAGNKGVLLQYSIDNGITWVTISLHDPLDFRKARRVVYSIPDEAKCVGLLLRWWQPVHNGIGTDQWALDNIEFIANDRKTTNEYERRLFS